MKSQTIAPLLWLAISMAVLSFTACGTKTETQKTTVIEREVESPNEVSVSITGKKKGNHLHISGGE
jgi:hypothetical protein